jgi:hypothetical protein
MNVQGMKFSRVDTYVYETSLFGDSEHFCETWVTHFVEEEPV